MQIKIHREISLTPIRRATIQKQDKMVSGGEEMEKKYPRALLVAVSARTALVENTMEGPQKVKNRTTM